MKKNCILFCLAGSHAYGLNTPTSDYDYKGITVAPLRFYIGVQNFEQKNSGWHLEEGIFPEHDKEVDSVFYDIRRFLHLSISQAPNNIEMLWQKPETYLYLNDMGKLLLKHKEDLLSKKSAGSFAGYADAQLKKC